MGQKGTGYDGICASKNGDLDISEDGKAGKKIEKARKKGDFQSLALRLLFNSPENRDISRGSIPIGEGVEHGNN